MPPIHYLWVGPRASDQYKGQDTVGPDLMHQKFPEQPIFFWCLEEEKPYYEKYFKERPAIKVMAIEPYVREKSRSDDFSEFIETVKKRAKEFPNKKDKIREWITIKDAFAYFLQIQEEGYICDTNVIPDPSQKAQEDTISVPSSFSDSFVTEWPGFKRPDPWLMFAIKGDAMAKERFDKYFKEVSALFEHCKGVPQQNVDVIFSNGDTFNLRILVTSAFVNSAMKADPLETKRYEGTLNTNVGFFKRYYSSHNDIYRKPLTHDILNGPSSIDELMYFVKMAEIEPFDEYEYQQDTWPLRTSLIEQARRGSRYSELAALLSFSKSPLAAQASEDIIFLLNLTKKIYPPTTELLSPITIEKISSALRENPKERYIVKALELYSRLGLLDKDNLEDFLNELSSMAKTENSQYDHGHGLFVQKAQAGFDLSDARQQLEQYLSQQDHQKKYDH